MTLYEDNISRVFYAHVNSNKGYSLLKIMGDRMSESELMCKCGLPAKLVTCKKYGPHQGWLFATCPKDNRVDDTHCKYFKWVVDSRGVEVPDDNRRPSQFSRPTYNNNNNRRYTNAGVGVQVVSSSGPIVKDLPPPPPPVATQLDSHVKFLFEYLLDNDKSTVNLKDYYDKHFTPQWTQQGILPLQL